MREAVLYQRLDDGNVLCQVCAHSCSIAPGMLGRCGVRYNAGGQLLSTVYGLCSSVAVDPIEKKPLFHFLPGTQSLSYGTVGCNFNCDYCQNWELSRGTRPNEGHPVSEMELSPEALIEHCVRYHLPSISSTYNEPSVFLEYALETAQLAHQRGVKTVFVSNGYQSPLALQYLAPHLDAINIDLKSFSEPFYREHCQAHLQPVLDTIVLARELKIWTEVTTLIIPGLNSSSRELTEIAQFIAGVSLEIPWHLTAFHPDYLMADRPATEPELLLQAVELGRKTGLHYVYAGNIIDPDTSTTWCPKCSAALIGRYWHSVKLNRLQDGRCFKCGTVIPGVWS